MKKLSTLIAIALIVTIGSVYAAWSYSHGTAASSEITREINMAQVNTDSNKGTISVTPNNFAFLVDDVGAVDYVAVLTGSGDLTVNFTPAAGSDASLSTTGIQMVATVTVITANGGGTYSGKDSSNQDVTVTPLAANTTDNKNVIPLTGNGIGTSTKLTAVQILGALIFNSGKELKLPTKADNDNYHAVLKNYTIKITISEVVTGA